MPILLEILAAGGGCAVADSLFNFLEVMKVKLQVQARTEPLMYQGMLSGLRRVVTEDGAFHGLVFPGLTATLLRAFTYTGFRIGLYPTVRDFIAPTGSSSAPTLQVKVTLNALPHNSSSKLNDTSSSSFSTIMCIYG